MSWRRKQGKHCRKVQRQVKRMNRKLAKAGLPPVDERYESGFAVSIQLNLKGAK